MNRLLPLGLALSLVVASGTAEAAGRGRSRVARPRRCQSDCASACPSYALVEKTIMVPTWVEEPRTVQVTEYRAEERQRTYTVYKRVPETRVVTEQYTENVRERRVRTERYVVRRAVTRQVTREVTVMTPHRELRQGTRRVCKFVPVTETRIVKVPEARTKTETYTVCKPVMRQETREIVVNVPRRERREGVRRVCRWVPVVEQRTIREDHGHYEEVICATGPSCGTSCGSACRGCHSRRGMYRRRCGNACPPQACPPAMIAHRVWVPNVVERVVNVTCNRRTMVEEPYSYEVTVCRPEKRTQTVTVQEMVRQEMTRTVPYTVLVPQEQTVTVNRKQMVDEPYTYEVTVCRPEKQTKTFNVCEYVDEERTREIPYFVCVPVTRTRERTVTTCKTVAEERTETYTVRVPYETTKTVMVRVCRLAPKTIMVRVPACSGCGAAAPCASCCK